MSNNWGPLPAQKTSRTLKWWLVAAAVAVLFILLLVFLPILTFFLSMIAFVVGLIALAFGRVRWARIGNRKSAAGVMGGAVVTFVVSTVIVGLSLPTETSTVRPLAGTEIPASAQEATLASFVDQACDADHLVMTQGNESNYCDKNDLGAFVWVGQTAHDQTEAKAAAEVKAKTEKLAEQKAAAEAKAKTEKLAEQRAAAEVKAKEEATKQKDAEKKATEEKAAAEAKVKAKKDAERKAEAAAAAREAAAAKELADRQAEVESFVEDTAGSSAYYANCTAVKAAGADPIYSGDPGYSRKLDRDGDGVGCE